MSTTESHRFYFRQLLSGQDFAQGDMMATQMVNFAYLLGDRDSGECVIVDPAYAVHLVHTPGHTPGSQCFLVNGCLVSGDTLFLDGCGRTDLPGSDVGQMYESLSRLATLPDETVVLPGHRYSEPPAARLSDVKAHNYVFKPKTKEAWLTMFGHD